MKQSMTQTEYRAIENHVAASKKIIFDLIDLEFKNLLSRLELTVERNNSIESALEKEMQIGSARKD